ncbi:MAG TPA: ribosome biogenesis GTPase Der, partial [Gallionella sp.]|nr:ribosome biogenesis GTPase Der [Gallionella sp.]
NVVVLVLDARQDVSEQDAHIAGFVVESGRAVVVAVNKWEDLPADRRNTIKNDIARKLQFLDFAKYHFISALQGSGVGGMFKSIDAAYAAAMAKLPTPMLTRVLMAATAQHQPPKDGPFRPKLRYAHQGGQNPPLVVIHGSALGSIPDSYRRYLEGVFRKAFELGGTPLRVQFKQGHNPFEGRKQVKTEADERAARSQRRRGRKTYGKR